MKYTITKITRMYVLNVHIGLHALLIHLITRNWRLRDEHSLKLRDMTLYRVIQRSIDNAFTSKSLCYCERFKRIPC
jgi:hypothetical protein